MIAAIVCEKMGWTFDEFESQPVWFIDVLLMKWVEESNAQKENNKVLE